MSDLQTELQNLLDQRDALTEQLRNMENDTERILNAIKNQRWFFFKNKPNIIFDRDTALLWADLKSFPYEISSRYYKLYEVQSLIDNTNIIGIDGFKNWRIPTPAELWKIIVDTTFPYSQVGNMRIKNRLIWCVYHNGRYMSKDLSYSSSTSGLGYDFVSVIPCSDTLQPANYETCAADAKTRHALNIFKQNKLQPIFTDASVTELYRQIYIVKLDVRNNLDAVQQKISELQAEIDYKAIEEAKRKAERFDLVTLEKKFGDGADTSPIRYALAAKNLTEYLSMKFGEYVAEKADVLAELQKLPAAPKFIPDIKKLRADLNNFHADALKIYSSFIDAENLHGLYNLYKESYPPFSIVAETLTEKIRQVILRVEIFEVMPNFLREICAEVTKKFNGNDKIKPYFDAVTEIYSNLFSYVLEGHLRQEIVKKAAAERVLEILNAYRKSIDNLKEDAEIARCGKICKNSLKEIEESLTDETEKRWLRINCIEKISG